MRKDLKPDDLNELHRQAKSARARYEPIWFMNLSYTQGDQWLAWGGGNLYRPQMPPNRITIVDNRILPCVNTEIAKMTKSRPVFTVTPRSADAEDTNASELGEQVMRYLWKHANLHELTIKALRWSRITGAGFLKSFWDPTVGDSREVLMDQDGQVVPGPDGRPMDPAVMKQLPPHISEQLVVKTISQGDIRVEARSPFQMFIDPLADTFEEAEWVIEESVKSADYVQARYGKDIAPDTPANPGLIEARMGGQAIGSSGSYKGVKVREYWCKPNKRHPDGFKQVWAKDQILLTDNEPFDPMPYVMLSGIPVPGRLWPTSIVEQLRGPQTELNKVKSQIAENRNRVGNPTLAASKQAVQDADKLLESLTLPGGVLFYDETGSANPRPDYILAPPLPQYVIDQVPMIEESIQEISGQHEVASAQVPPGVTAASAINLLQEADDTRLGPALADYEYQLGKLGQKLLGLVARYYTDARAIRIAGDNGAWQIFDFRGTMLRDNTQVEVQAGSAFPQSKAAKQAAMQDLLTFFVQSGNPPHGRQLAQFLKDWEVGGADRLIDEYTVDETQCNRENLLLSRMQPLDINPYDNDEAHIANHTDFQKQATYAQLPDPAKQIFELHVTAHRQRLAQAQQMQAAAQMTAQGQPPPGAAGQQLQLAMQGAQADQQTQAAQGAQQLQTGAQQQGFSAADAIQQQRHSEEAHQQQLGQAKQLHEQKVEHARQLHEAKLRAQQKEAA